MIIMVILQLRKEYYFLFNTYFLTRLEFEKSKCAKALLVET